MSAIAAKATDEWPNARQDSPHPDPRGVHGGGDPGGKRDYRTLKFPDPVPITLRTVLFLEEQMSADAPADLRGISDIARVREIDRRLRSAELVGYVALAVPVALATFWVGIWPIAMIAAEALVALVLRRAIATRPGYVALIHYEAIVAQLLLSTGIMLTGGVASPALVWLTLQPIGVTTRIGLRHGAASIAYTSAFVLAIALLPHSATKFPQWFYGLTTLAMLPGLVAYVGSLFGADVDHFSESSLDPLTGALNRRALDWRLEYIAATGAAATVVALDIDHFKAVNDRYGHECGDTVLRDVVAAVNASTRDPDAVYRLGGDEFVIVLAGAGGRGAVVAERIRAAVARRPADQCWVTISAGVASAGSPDPSLRAALERADQAMYAAKRAGGDRVVLSRETLGAQLSRVG
jgi:diguanylate cyclase (GGDEF)-like protein